MRAAVYARLSVAGDEDADTGIDRQERDCRAMAERREATSIALYRDDGFSAFNRRTRRPEFERLLADMASGSLDIVIAWRGDRLARQGWDAARILKAIDDAPSPVTVYGMADGVDTSTTMGRMYFTMLVFSGNAESTGISVRVRRAAEERARSGQFGGGPRAFGHNADRSEVIPDEADAIRDAARRILDGESVKSVLRDWNSRGIVTPRQMKDGIPTGRGGNRWQHTAFVNLLQQPRMAGMRRLRGIEGTGAIPAIVDREQWERLCALLTDPTRHRPMPGGQATHLLSGILLCAECGIGMRAKGNAGGHNGPDYWTYSCMTDRPGACGRVHVRGDKTDDYIEGLTIAALSAPGLAALVAERADDDDSADVRRSYVAAQERADAFEAQWLRSRAMGDPDASDTAYRTVRDELRAAADALRRRMAASESNRALASVLTDPEQSWQSASNDDRRTLVRLVFPTIKVARANRRRWSAERIILMPAA